MQWVMSPTLPSYGLISIIYHGSVPLGVIAAFLYYLARTTSPQVSSKPVSLPSRQPNTPAKTSNSNFDSTYFQSFQRNFCVVYILALFADGLQGPYIYKLYEHYGFQEFQIAQLYVVGFASSLLFGTVTGPIADSIGRKNVCLFFSAIYIVCCLSKFSHNFWILWWGRICGGISTSILYSTFEAWYVYEHNQRHCFPENLIGNTFSITTFWNGLTAITAGMIANSMAVALGFGPVAPFGVAIIPLIICGMVVLKSWPENYGQKNGNILDMSRDGLAIIWNDSAIMILGGIQTAVESVMYIFVYLWTPVLGSTGLNPPLGIIFSCFMIAIMIGSNLYTYLTNLGWKSDTMLQLCLVMTTISMIICSVVGGPDATERDLIIVYLAFLVKEVAIGLYYPAMSQCRSQVIPESHRANVMNFFRVPLNIITCATLLLTHVEFIAEDKRIMFQACVGLSLLGLILSQKFMGTLEHYGRDSTKKLDKNAFA